MTQSALAAVRQWLWPAGERREIWAILDGARDRGIFSFLIYSNLEHSCLYAGDLHPELEIAAPYLVRLEDEDSDTRQLIGLAWGNSWGVLLRSDASMSAIRRHLRTLLMVRGPSGQRLAFRYYDPRVLRIYLPTCTSDELRQFFGPVRSFCMESDDPGEALEFRLDRGKLVTRTLTLADADLGAARRL